MALIKPAVIIDKISGSAGSDTFVNSTYGGPQLRRKVYHKDLFPSDAKAISNKRCGNVTRLWAEVSPAQLLEWEKFAKTFKRINRVGVKLPVRPIDSFKQVNNNLVGINEPHLLSPPKKVYPKEFESIEVKIISRTTNNDQLSTNLLEDIRVFFKPSVHKDTKVVVYATGILKGGVNKPKDSKYRRIAIMDSAFISGISLLSSYLSVFQVDNKYPVKIAFRFKPVSRISWPYRLYNSGFRESNLIDSFLLGYW